MSQHNMSASIEKLQGRENYNTWKFGMQAYLEHEDLWGCVLGEETYVADKQKDTKAKSKIILTIDPINYVHIQNCKTAKETWEKLKTTFEDSGLTRKVGLLRTLVTTQLRNCNNVEEYVNKIIVTAHKLNNLGFEVPDLWIGTLLLAGLPEEYRPMIMGIESSGTSITADSIKTKLLQDIKHGKGNSEHESALYTKKNNFRRSHQERIRCFSCNRFGHYANNCRSKNKNFKENKKEEKHYTSKQNSDRSFFAFHCLTSIVTVFGAEKTLSKLFIKFGVSRTWTFERQKLEFISKVKTESKRITVYALCNLVILLMFSVFNLPWFSQNNDIFYGAVLLENRRSKIAYILTIIYYITFPIMAYVAFIIGGFLIYTLTLLRFNTFIINDFLETLFRNYSSREVSALICNENYQMEVLERLKICIIRHQVIKKIERELNMKILSYLIILLYLTVATIIIMFFNILIDDTTYSCLRGVCGIFVSLTSPLLIAHAGQALKNENEKIFENILNFPWPVWNMKNRKILIIFIINVQKPFSLGQPGLVLCEYSFVPTVLSFIWTVATFIIQLVSNK